MTSAPAGKNFSPRTLRPGGAASHAFPKHVESVYAIWDDERMLSFVAGECKLLHFIMNLGLSALTVGAKSGAKMSYSNVLLTFLSN